VAKLADEDLLELLNRKESSAAHYVHGDLGDQREVALKEYYRMPYGNEAEGWSSVVASDVQDTVEWILPALLKVFTSTDKAVQFEPSTANDVEPAEQATDACNYVFYKQNNGFLTLYTAIKDMLTVRNCAVMWRKETSETVSSVPFKNASQEMLAMLMQEQDAEIQEASPAPVIDPNTGQPEIDLMTGQPIMGYSGRLKKTEKRTIVKVEAFSPEDLLVERDWTSPILADCPYVARLMRCTLSELKNMGFDVTPEDLRSSDITDSTSNDSSRLSNINVNDTVGQYVEEDQNDDDSMAEGWLRIEYVLADADGDGIAERLCIYRLQGKILSKEVCSHVQIATSSPILNTHRWDGMSMADAVSDLQKLHTDLLRQTLDNLKLTNNPRKNVLTDANWSPLANLDDLLDSRIGGITRVRDVNAVTDNIVPFTAGASMPMLEYIQGMRENRTGVSRTSMGLNPDSLNNTATGRQIDQSAAMQRIELIARIVAETLVKPIFQGILKVLTDGGMEKLSFRLRDKFVEYDPNEWRDQYDMTINVGLGTGDKAQQAQQLMAIWQMQTAGMQFGIATPKHLYATAAKQIENAGFKDVQNFVQDPSTVPPQPPPPPPYQVQIEQMKQQADAQKFQAETQADIQKFQAETAMTREVEQIKADAKLQEIRANLELQAANDARDSEREQMKAQFDAAMEAQRLEFDRWKAELDARVKLRIAQIGKEQSGDELMDAVGDADAMGKPSPVDQLSDMHQQSMQAIALLAETIANPKPKQIVRDANGRAVGVV
jgi:hypothetical protein